MARPTKDRAALSPAEVDALDLSVLAALLGVYPQSEDDPLGMGPLSGDFAADSARVLAARVAEARTAPT